MVVSRCSTKATSTGKKDDQIVHMHSHHSHSGEFCLHAQDKLEDIIAKACSLGFHTWALTEHMPRDRLEDLYPEEISHGVDVAYLDRTFDLYMSTAHALRRKYSNKMNILVGFETEYIRPESVDLVRKLMARYAVDYVVGSIHHVKGIPIDFSAQKWNEAASQCLSSFSTDTQLACYATYFDQQYDLMRQLKPRVIGHFDVIRLFSPDPDFDFSSDLDLWSKICRNIEYAVEYEALFEINTSAWRKGLQDPYPNRQICAEIHRLKGHFCLSDDSHGLNQVACHVSQNT